MATVGALQNAFGQDQRSHLQGWLEGWRWFKENHSEGNFYWSPNQDNKTNKAIFGSLKQALEGSQNLVHDWWLQPSRLFWGEQYSSSHVIHQVPGVPRRTTSSYKCKRCAKQQWGTAGLRNWENLLWNTLVSDSLGYSGQSIVEFGIRLGMLKVGTKPKVLDFRRASFSSLKAQVAGRAGGKGEQ